MRRTDSDTPSAGGEHRGSDKTNPDGLDLAAIYRAVSTSVDQGLLLQDLDGTILWANAAYGRIMGYDVDDLIGRHPLSFALPPEDTPSPEEIAAFRFERPPGGGPWIEVFRNRRSTGELFWIEMHVSFEKLRDYGEVVVLAARDISDHIDRQMELEKTSAELGRIAATDNLTGLANRLAIMPALTAALDEMRGTSGRLGLMHIDLDRFKAVNDSHGHSAGDAILCHVARCMTACLPAGVIAARIGGDEFVVLSTDARSEEAFAALGAALIAAARQPLLHDGTKLSASLSIGAAIAPPEGLTADDLLKRADFALYDAKDRGGGQVAVYDDALHARKQSEDQLAQDLRHAIETRQITFVFQPAIWLETGHIHSFEALARWDNPRLGPVEPATFMPLARTLGLLPALDRAALDAAVRLRADLIRLGFADIRVGINASAELLGQDSFLADLPDILAGYGVAPEDLIIDVLETAVMSIANKDNPLVHVVKDLRSLGVTVLLDDFGTGYLGMTHLNTLVATGVKLDRSMTQTILTNLPNAKIIAMMHELCDDLGLQVMAEGVETGEQADALRAMGGTLLQGHWLARPMPADEVATWLQNRPAYLRQPRGSAIAALQEPRYLGAKDF